MHQVLSYETAVRANSSREFREYVSKRTCVSLILTIAFFTLISGYLLGTFVADRKNHIRQMVNKKAIKPDDESAEQLTGDDYANLNQLHAYGRIKDQLLATAQALDKRLHRDENYLSTSLNTEIFNKYISCTQDIPPNTTIETSTFIEQLVDNTAARQRDCLRIIQVILNEKSAGRG